MNEWNMRTGNQDIIILFYSTVVELIPFYLQQCTQQSMSSFTLRIISSISSAIILVSIFLSQNCLGSHRLVTPYHICLIYLGQLKELNVCTAKKKKNKYLKQYIQSTLLWHSTLYSHIETLLGIPWYKQVLLSIKD